MKPLKAYQKRFVEYRLMVKLNGKEVAVGSAINCLDDIIEDPDSSGRYVSELLNTLVSVGALTQKYNHYQANDSSQEWFEALCNCWSKAGVKLTEKTRKKEKKDV